VFVSARFHVVYARRTQVHPNASVSVVKRPRRAAPAVQDSRKLHLQRCSRSPEAITPGTDQGVAQHSTVRYEAQSMLGAASFVQITFDILVARSRRIASEQMLGCRRALLALGISAPAMPHLVNLHFRCLFYSSRVSLQCGRSAWLARTYALRFGERSTVDSTRLYGLICN